MLVRQMIAIGRPSRLRAEALRFPALRGRGVRLMLRKTRRRRRRGRRCEPTRVDTETQCSRVRRTACEPTTAIAPMTRARQRLPGHRQRPFRTLRAAIVLEARRTRASAGRPTTRRLRHHPRRTLVRNRPILRPLRIPARPPALDRILRVLGSRLTRLLVSQTRFRLVPQHVCRGV